MKRKYIAAAMGLVLALTSAGAYASETTETVTEAAVSDGMDENGASAAETAEQETVTGQVTEIGENTITVSVMSGMGMSGDAGDMPGGAGDSQNADGSADAVSSENTDSSAEAETSEAAAEESPEENAAPELPDSTEGETQTITLTDETQYLKSSGGMGGMSMSGGSGDGSVPEMPGGSGDSSSVPEKPEGEGGDTASGDSSSVPEKPEGESGDVQPDGAGDAASGDSSSVPEKPEGESGDVQPDGARDAASGDSGSVPEMPSGDMSGMGGTETEEITLADIAVGDMVQITLNEDGTAATVTVTSMDMGGGQMGGGSQPGGMSQGVDSYTSVENPTEDTTLEGQEISSTGTDENAVLTDSDITVTLSNDTITRNSSDSTGGDNSSFYGVGAAVLGTDGTTIVSGSTVTTDAAGGAGIFAYGDGVVYVMDTTVSTEQDTSGGIHAAGGGTLYAWDVTAVTQGESSAAIRSDRGGGTMVVDGGSYTSNGVGSPAVYCTADISINNAELTATGSEAVCIEGLNTVRLYDCTLSGNMSDNEQNDNTWTVIVYQSMSGDSEVGNGTFQMTGGSLISGNGGIFYTTNTESTITLENVAITYAEDSEFFLQCTGNSNARGWGQTGSNGADCLFTAISQEMQGNVIWDSISNLDFYMTEGSVLTGAFVNDETWAGEGGSGTCNVVISEDSQWIVTGDSTVTSLSNSGSIVDESGSTVTIQGTDGTVYVQGDSAYTITVESYSDSADVSGASSTDDFSAHEVERPEV